MNKILQELPSIIFNIAEAVLIFMIGKLLKLDIIIIIYIIGIFAIIRIGTGGAMHYKDWYRCMVWSSLVFLSLFVVAKADISISIIMTIFCAYILTAKGNINDIFMWKQGSKYKDIDDYIQSHQKDNKLIEFENKLKTKSELDYLIYQYRFIDRMSLSKMSNILEMENPRIIEKLDNIAFAMRIYCGI